MQLFFFDAGSMAGLRAAVSMKQVGLNVASDPLMSAAYMGTVGDFIVISADDPGPHSFQTEQDSSMMVMMAKIPVLDPDSPRQAKKLATMAYSLSEQFRIPVMLRPTTWVCHSRQDVLPGPVQVTERKVEFKKDPTRWAATPKFRFQLHWEVENKLAEIAAYKKTEPVHLNPQVAVNRAVVASGVAAAYTSEVMKSLGLWDSLPLYQVLQPFPLHTKFINHLLSEYEDILVIEETTAVIEMQLADRNRVKGKLNRVVPRVGELLPEKIQQHVANFAGIETKINSLPTVVSHIKVGNFSSPLIRPAEADGILALKAENMAQHGAFLKPGAWAAVNSPESIDGNSTITTFCVDEYLKP